MKKTKKKKKRIRLKYEFKKFMVYFTFFLIMTIYTFNGIKDIKEKYEYQKTDEYIINNMGYTMEQTTYFLTHLSEDKITFIKENEYNELYYNIATEKYYLNKNFEKYLNYIELHEDVELSKVIALVNVHAPSGWYNETFETDTSKDYAILVNKFYYLSKDFKREDIVSVSPTYAYYDNFASKEVIEAYEDMRNDVKENLNVNLMINSSFRSYEDQDDTYKSFLKAYGTKYTEEHVAKPGFSEHQTGLAIDLTSLEHKTKESFTKSKEYAYLKENCYKYGFILRYPEEKKDITGYDTESWHFRYVGLEIASAIHDEEITFDEYYAYYIEGDN